MIAPCCSDKFKTSKFSGYLINNHITYVYTFNRIKLFICSKVKKGIWIRFASRTIFWCYHLRKFPTKLIQYISCSYTIFTGNQSKYVGLTKLTY